MGQFETDRKNIQMLCSGFLSWLLELVIADFYWRLVKVAQTCDQLIPPSSRFFACFILLYPFHFVTMDSKIEDGFFDERRFSDKKSIH